MTLSAESGTVSPSVGEFRGRDTEGIGGRPSLRALTRGGGAILVTLGLFALWCAGAPVAAIRRRWLHRWQAVILRHWGRSVAWCLRVRVTVQGRPPTRPFMLVSNHLSYLDIIVYATQVGGMFISKAEVRQWPGLGFLSRAMGTIFIDRTSKRDALRTLARIRDVVELGGGVVIFPEGTSSAGAGVLPFKPALLDYAARTRFPVTVARVTYTTAPGDPPPHLAVCWWGDMTFLPHATRLASLRGVQATIIFDDDPVQDDDRRRLAERLREAVAARFESVVPREPA